MSTSFSPEERKRYESYLKVHLKEHEQSLPESEQVEALQKKNRNKWWLLLLNIAAIVFFGYSFLYGITTLSDTLFYILVAVFIINVGLILYQKKQLKELIEYVKRKQ